MKLFGEKEKRTELKTFGETRRAASEEARREKERRG